MNVLLIGPPGSGKTRAVLDALEAAGREGRGDEVLLVTPTAGMARHLLHEAARRLGSVATDLVLPISDVVRRLTPALREPTAAEIDWLVGAAIEQAGGDFFAPLAGSPGLISTARRAILELQSAKCPPAAFQAVAGTPRAKALAAVYSLYERFLRAHEFTSSAERLIEASTEAAFSGLRGASEIYFDGFVNFPPGEADLIKGFIAGGRGVTVTAPDASAAVIFPDLERRCLREIRRPVPCREVFAAETIDDEVSEIARLILEAGRPFGEIGVIARSPETYASTIAAVFERFGIPFRTLRSRPLADDGAVAFLLDLLRLAEAGLPGAETLEALKRPACRLADVADDYEFRTRARLPGAGAEFLRRDASPAVANYIERWEEVAAWSNETATPEEWTRRLAAVRPWALAPPRIADDLSIERIVEVRKRSAALRAWDAALEEAAELLKTRGLVAVSFSQYREALGVVLASKPLRAPDQRRDVVHVLSVFEARQWELPVVFVCGLAEGWFPQAISDDGLLRDDERRRLRREGFRFRTSEDRAREEEDLFHVAETRASERLILSYPEADAGGGPLMRSLWLGPPTPAGDRRARPVRPRETAPDCDPERDVGVSDPVLLARIAQKDAYGPSLLDVFLECPYKYFARSTLGLEEPPPKLERRIDALVKGSIIHRTIEEWSRSRERPIREVLRAVIDEELLKIHQPETFRVAMTLAHLEEDLERFAAEPWAQPIPGSTAHAAEEAVEFVVDSDDEEPFTITARVDRVDLIGDKAALVVDYKHSSKNGIKKRVEEHDRGERLQGLLYLAGMVKARGCRPAGMLFFGLRKETSLGGWVVKGLLSPSMLPTKLVAEIGEEELIKLIEEAQRSAARVIGRIRAGDIDVAPRDKSACDKFCDFRDVCRVKP